MIVLTIEKKYNYDKVIENFKILKINCGETKMYLYCQLIGINRILFKSTYAKTVN
jgi:hypothetical protein